MQSMIEQLYYGGIQFDTRYYGKGSPFVHTAKKKAESYDKLITLLNDTEKALLEQFCAAQADIEDIVRYDIYTETLRFGVRLMAEVFMNSEGWSAGERMFMNQMADANDK